MFRTIPLPAGSPDSSVNTVATTKECTSEKLGSTPGRSKIQLLYKTAQNVSAARTAYSIRSSIKLPIHSTFTGNVKIMWSCNSTSPHAFMVRTRPDLLNSSHLAYRNVIARCCRYGHQVLKGQNHQSQKYIFRWKSPIYHSLPQTYVSSNS
jgi:hypothetical protein